MLTLATTADARLALTIEQLCRAIAVRSPRAGLALPLMVLAWSWLRRTAGRFARLAERLRAGRLRPRRRRAVPPSLNVPPPARPQRLPRGSGWLLRHVPEARGSASQLESLLQGPEMAALLAAAPQAGRLLRPLCRMLGIDHPPLRLPERPRPLARAPAPRAAAPPAALAPPRPPSPAWLRRTSLRGRRRPNLIGG